MIYNNIFPFRVFWLMHVHSLSPRLAHPLHYLTFGLFRRCCPCFYAPRWKPFKQHQQHRRSKWMKDSNSWSWLSRLQLLLTCIYNVLWVCRHSVMYGRLKFIAFVDLAFIPAVRWKQFHFLPSHRRKKKCFLSICVCECTTMRRVLIR